MHEKFDKLYQQISGLQDGEQNRDLVEYLYKQVENIEKETNNIFTVTWSQA